MYQTVFITGGTRSGKTDHARAQTLQARENLAFSGPVLWAALGAPPPDEEKNTLRFSELGAVSDPTRLIQEAEGMICVLDSLADWIRCRLQQKEPAEAILAKVENLARAVAERPFLTVVVSNEIGGGVVPVESADRLYRDLVGAANQRLATAFDQVIHMVAGLPQEIKSTRNREANGVPQAFAEADKAAVYEAIYLRRDIRHFKTDAVPEPLLFRILDAAHHAGSVGFMQPWDFVVVRDPEVRREVTENFKRANAEARNHYEGDRQELYDSLKLAGLQEAPVHICVTCDTSRGGPHGLGRNTIPETDVYSTCCAVQNLWLAARAEGLGVGWVSILSVKELKQTLHIPEHILPVAYLCVGYPSEFYEAPMLETAGWASRLPLERVLHFDRYQDSKPTSKDDHA